MSLAVNKTNITVERVCDSLLIATCDLSPKAPTIHPAKAYFSTLKEPDTKSKYQQNQTPAILYSWKIRFNSKLYLISTMWQELSLHNSQNMYSEGDIV